MKNLKILLFGLLVAFFSVSSANAQTFQEKSIVNFCISYDCDGVWDWACGDVVFHDMYHVNKEGFVDWYKIQITGKDLVSSTGEVFKLSFSVKNEGYVPGEVLTATYHFNLVGNMGTHVIYSVTYEFDTATVEWTLIDEKSKCL